MSYTYRIKRVPHGYAVCADGFVTRSAPYGTWELAHGSVTHLLKVHPGSIFAKE